MKGFCAFSLVAVCLGGCSSGSSPHSQVPGPLERKVAALRKGQEWDRVVSSLGPPSHCMGPRGAESCVWVESPGKPSFEVSGIAVGGKLHRLQVRGKGEETWHDVPLDK